MKRIKGFINSLIVSLRLAFIALFASPKNENSSFTVAKAGGLKLARPFGFGNAGAYACVALQKNLVDFFGKNVSEFRTLAQVSLIKWLYSPQNMSGVEMVNTESVPGKRRPVIMRFDDPFCFDLCRADLACNQTPIYLDPNINQVVWDLEGAPFRHCDGSGNPVLLRFAYEDMMKWCNDTDQSIITNRIARYLIRFEQALDKQLGTVFATLPGHNGKDQAITNIPLWLASSTVPGSQALNPAAVFYLNQVYQDMAGNGQYALLGGALLNKIAFYQKWVNNNDLGVDMSKSNDLNPYVFYNRNLEGILGDTDLILAAPNTVQLATWNLYKGEKRRSVTDLYTHGTVVLPTTGIEVDFEWIFDPKCKVWTFEAFLYCELIAARPGGCGAGLANVNGIIRIHDCSNVDVVPECPAP